MCAASEIFSKTGFGGPVKVCPRRRSRTPANDDFLRDFSSPGLLVSNAPSSDPRKNSAVRGDCAVTDGKGLVGTWFAFDKDTVSSVAVAH